VVIYFSDFNSELLIQFYWQLPYYEVDMMEVLITHGTSEHGHVLVQRVCINSMTM
jgi:hypothetical protein